MENIVSECSQIPSRCSQTSPSFSQTSFRCARRLRRLQRRRTMLLNSECVFVRIQLLGGLVNMFWVLAQTEHLRTQYGHRLELIDEYRKYTKYNKCHTNQHKTLIFLLLFFVNDGSSKI